MKNTLLKNTLFILIAFTLMMLTACGDGSSSSGGETQAGGAAQVGNAAQAEGETQTGGTTQVTAAADTFPANFVGIYRGTVNVVVRAAGISKDFSFPVTITITADGILRFEGEDPNDMVIANADNSGQFSLSAPIPDGECQGAVIELKGTVDGAAVSGTVAGNGACIFQETSVSVVLSGSFNANKS